MKPGLGTRATRTTWTLTTLLAALALALAGRDIGAVEAGPHPELVVALALAAVFFLAETCFVDIEFQKQSHLLTFAGVPLALGLLVAPTRDLVLARAVGAGIALVVQKVPFQKLVYNVAAYAAEAAVGSYLVHTVLHLDAGDDPLRVLVFVLVVAAVDQVMSALVLFLIRVHGGSPRRRDVVDVLVPSLVLSVVTSVFAVALRMLLHTGTTGVALVAVLIVAAVLVYRSYAATRRRHGALEVVHDFVALGVGAESLGELGVQTLNRIRTQLRAARVQVLLAPADAVAGPPSPPGDYHLMEVGEDEQLVTRGDGLDPTDWIRSKALHSGEPTLAAAGTKERAVVHWLAHHGFHDALVAPLRTGRSVLGVVTVADRLGDTNSFTAEDLALLETLTNHLAVAIRSTRLLERLGHDATHDALTGLANRAHLGTRMLPDADSARRCAVVLLDIDRFKEVNDVLGHDVGDRLLVVVAQRLLACVPADSTVARLGGDEFAVLLPDLEGDDPTGAAVDVAETVAAALAAPVRIDEALVSPAASVGVAVGEPGDDLVRRADTAMYAAKAGEGPVAVYHPDMERGRAERLALVADLRIALESDPEQFQLFYQPKTDLASGAVVGCEALVRWQHPTRGLVPPDTFIALTEAAGLIGRLTQHVLTSAVTDCARWYRDGHPVSVAVNLSPRDVADDALPGRVLAALATAGLPPDRLVLEVTEGSLLADPERAIAALARLAAAGVVVSLDDFGTGYSSLSYLQRLPAHEIKVDRSFVLALDGAGEGEAAALLRGIAGLAGSLGLRVVAEGIETEAQRREVLTLGCHIGQGYLWSRPLPAQEWATWLAERGTDPSTPLRLLDSPA